MIANSIRPQDAMHEELSEQVHEPPPNGGAAVVFVRRSATMGIGHVGWGFLIHQGTSGTHSLVGDGNIWEIGAVENHHGWLITPPLEDGYWRERTAQPLRTVAARGYDHYRVVAVSNVDIDAAVRAEKIVSERPYMAAVGNCMNDVYHILRAYGAHDMPDPEHIENWIPNLWYGRINAPEFEITDTSGLDEPGYRTGQPPE